MRQIIIVEIKRVLTLKIFLLIITIIALFSAISSYKAVGNYNIPYENGTAVSWQANLSHGKKCSKEKYINMNYLEFMKEYNERFKYIDKSNVDELISIDDSTRIIYTEKEKKSIMKEAKRLVKLPMGYSEGWKVINNGIGKFIILLLIIIFIILLFLLGSDPQIKMREIYRSTRFGKKKLDGARFLAAFIIAGLLYFLGVALYFIIKMFPFGLNGWNQPIQSNSTTFLSVYNITYLQQFIFNILIGLFAVIFVTSFTQFIMVLMDEIIPGAIVVVFFSILLVIFDQGQPYPINHYFANFMPIRMTEFNHFYVENDIYRVFGNSFTCFSWTIIVSLSSSIVFCVISKLLAGVRRKKGER
ncbi:hypothetical protein [Clostridium oryzae]|uniref:ABC-2 family transporter protein n=1 Tax=Clostridium oryzae TaxID=1450648 RepID=A0A1V4IW10_9CLOT|nr:hypothetical protein [Clostridium oryzae]OPJ64222.1 ABC-2 family transporter protein [Clostridium oryzae]